MCHYQISLNDVCRTLTDFDSSKQYIGAIADAMEAHDSAYFDANILHRDINVGNIILTDKQRGMLIDWDLCLKLNVKKVVPRRPDRTGMWQFMSAKLLGDLSQPQGIADDRESAFHVLLWVALRYSVHCSRPGTNILTAFDQIVHDRVGNPTGGDGKISFFVRYRTGGSRYLQFIGRPEMNNLVQDLVTAFNVRYDIGSLTQKDIQQLAKKEAKLKANEDNITLAAELREDIRLLPASEHQVRLDKLHKRGWLVDTIRSYLRKGEWPEDKSTPQIITKQRQWWWN